MWLGGGGLLDCGRGGKGSGWGLRGGCLSRDVDGGLGDGGEGCGSGVRDGDALSCLLNAVCGLE